MVSIACHDFMHYFELPDQKGVPFKLFKHSGDRMLLFFYPETQLPLAKELVDAFNHSTEDFTQYGVKLVGISMDSVEQQQQLSEELGVSFKLLSDNRATKLCRELGILQEVTQNNEKLLQFSYCAVLLDINLRVIHISHLTSAKDVTTLVSDCQQFFSNRTAYPPVRRQAPVLIIPNLFDKALCRRLIDTWYCEGNVESLISRPVDEGRKTLSVVDYGIKDRRDHILKEGEELTRQIDQIIFKRLVPEVKKAFYFDITDRGVYKISSYNADTGGYFRPHRDNTTSATAHWRFALSVNLNSGEYTGGNLNFLEYENGTFHLDTGDAAVFSAALYHEATNVIEGQRFAFLGFFYGENEVKMLEQKNK